DDGALAVYLPQLLLDDLVGGLLDGEALVLDQRDDVVGDGVADEELAVSGAGDATRLVIRIRPCTDDRGIAKASRPLVRHAARRGPRREVAIPIQRHCADGAEIARPKSQIRNPKSQGRTACLLLDLGFFSFGFLSLLILLFLLCFL